jgi:hypothetical protein
MVRTICETYHEAPVFFESFHADRNPKSGYIDIDRWNSMAGRQRFSQEMSGGKRQAVYCARERICLPGEWLYRISNISFLLDACCGGGL